MGNEGLNTLTQQLAKTPDGTSLCEAGCMVFYGGERKHHRDCAHYPESLTKMWHDTEGELRVEIDRMHTALGEILKAEDLEWAKCRALVALPD